MEVKGAFNLQSSGQLDCSAFQADAGSKKVIKGHYTCQGSVAKPGGQGSKASSSSGSTPTGKSAAGRVDVNFPLIMGGSTLIAGLLQLIV